MNDAITITINKWREFNPKSDKARHPHWFRVNNNIHCSHSLYGLTGHQRWIWICILSECSRRDSGSIDILISHLSVLSSSSESLVRETIDFLIKNKTLSVDCQSTVSSLSVHSHTYKHTNKHTNTLSSGDDLNLLVRVWNEESGPLPKVKELNKKRASLCKEALKKNKDPDYWRRLVRSLAMSKFHTGKNERGWKANFDYFLREDVQTKILEGSIGGELSHKGIVER